MAEESTKQLTPPAMFHRSGFANSSNRFTSVDFSFTFAGFSTGVVVVVDDELVPGLPPVEAATDDDVLFKRRTHPAVVLLFRNEPIPFPEDGLCQQIDQSL